ncbi:transformation/transcription domain-associated protein-like [Diaphorina citri]|uniref:Transformation/transcription domain-associated protein-like n=1 Tax=Diaphorina citri TaxID=121845 RepID=A0A3Q0IPG8_DIACI|nr:transformation/transcription domain-associated protein-like [Diaphorina citri]
MLELINRFPCNEHFKPHLEPLLKLCVDLLEKENEENVLVVIRIFFELHKHFRPPQHAEVPRFIKYTKNLYKGLGEYVNKMFDLSKNPQRQFNSISEVNVEAIVNEIYTVTPISVTVVGADKKPATKTIRIFPRGYQSLKSMQELPLIIVLVYQLYKENVKKDLEEFIPIILKTVNLKPPIDFVTAPEIYKEIYVDFIGAQIKTLSFLAYLVRFYQDILNKHSQLLVDGVLNLLLLCPSEVTSMRKELLIAARHILQTDFRTNFVPHMSQLFEEDFQLGSGWTTHESLRPLVYSTLADLVHHVRQLLPMSDLIKAVHLFSKNIHDETLPTTIHTMSCKLLRNVVDFIHTKNQAEIDQAFKSNTRIENHDYAEIESANNIMALETRRQINDLVFLYKLINNKHFCPDLLSQINIKVPTRETRNKVLFGLKKYKTNIDNNAPLQRSQRYWNMASDGGVDIFSDSVLNIIRLVESHILPFH